MGEAMHPAVTYLIYMASALAMLGVFTAVYTAVTRYRELSSSAKATSPPCCPTAALVGFSFTLCSSIAVHASFAMFLVWGLAAMLVQIIVYVVVERANHGKNDANEENNNAMGGLIGSISIAAGIVNAACLT